MFADQQYGSIVPRVYRRVFAFGEEDLQGNCSVGQLTTIGYAQQLKNGASLRKAYVDTGLLSLKLSSQEVYIHSDDAPRTRLSAESLILGMYPPDPSLTDVFDLYTVAIDRQFMIPNPKICPMYQKYVNEFTNSSIWTKHTGTVTKALFEDIKKATGFEIDQSSFNHFCDCLRTHYCHGLAWPQGMTMQLYSRAWEELSWQFFSQAKYPSVEENARTGIGFLLRKIWQNMNDSISGASQRKFLLYSGHDTTLIPLLTALQTGIEEWPHYASMMLVELYNITHSSGRAVRIVYNGKILSMPFCGNATLCDYNTFSQYMSTVTPPPDPDKICNTGRHKWKWQY